jgi:hypothetical protein
MNKLVNQSLVDSIYPNNWQDFGDYCESEEDLLEAIDYYKKYGVVPKKFYNILNKNNEPEMHVFLSQYEYDELPIDEKMSNIYYHIIETKDDKLYYLFKTMEYENKFYNKLFYWFIFMIIICFIILIYKMYL